MNRAHNRRIARLGLVVLFLPWLIAGLAFYGMST